MSDDLYNLAQQAGYFPMANPEEQDYGYASNAGQGLPAPAPVPTETETFNAPSTETESFNPATQPAPAAMPPGTKTAIGTSTGTSNSNSGKGLDAGKLGMVGQTQTPLHQQMQATDAEARAQGQAEVAALNKAGDEAKIAQGAVAAATVDKIHAEGHQAALMQNLQNTFAEDETQINAAAQAESAKAKADYMAALTDFRASRVDPSQLWHGMSAGQRFGTLASVFVHDFLGAKGIHTSAMDTLNTAIDRNINAQVEAIKVKGQVAEGFKDLWYMQRSQSASDAEARTRVRGFLLEGAKQQVIANMSQYESGMATAQGQAAIAAIDGELAKQFVQVSHHVDENINARRQQALSEWATKLQNAQASYATASANRNAEMDRQSRERIAAMKQGGADPMLEGVFYDFNGKPVGRFNPDIKPEEKEKLRTKASATKILMNDVLEYQKMLRDYDAVSGSAELSQRFRNTHEAEMYALQGRIVMNEQRRTTGLVARENESAMIKAQVPMNNVWQRNRDVDKIVSQFGRRGLEELNAATSQMIKPLSEDEKKYIPPNMTNGFAPAQGKDWELTGSGQAGEKTYDQKAAEDYAGMVHGVESTSYYKGQAADIKKAHERLINDLPAPAAEAYATETGGGRWRGTITSGEVGLTRLAEMARDGNKEAAGLLEHEAEPYINGKPGSESDWRGIYAAFLLSDIKNGKDVNGFNPSAPSDAALDRLAGPRAVNPGALQLQPNSSKAE